MSAVTVEDRGPVSIIRINRPERLNAINKAVAIELQAAFQAFDRDTEKRVAILSGAGDKAFTSGADVSDLPELWRAIPGVGFKTDKPVIAATSGWVIGGGIVMAMMCDLMVSTENTLFYYPEAKLGTTAGGISSLVARMPHKLAMEIMLLGAKVPASRAYEVGFVNKVVAVGEQRAAALDYARRLAENAPLVLQLLKRFVGRVLSKGPSELAGIARRDVEAVTDSADLQEGLAAFRAKRPLSFSGN